MPVFSVDTSNYTTSVALAFEDGTVYGEKKLLPVKPGERGIRQSDAVFHHTKAYSELVKKLLNDTGFKGEITAVGASVTPTTREKSYMPCFLVGENFGRALASCLNVPFYSFSHQQGHIAAALYSSGNADLVNSRFIAFHVSGGTTDVVLCEPSDDTVIKVTPLCSSNDLKAGQAIDRIGVKMGLKFPCGPELEKLALNSDKTYKNKIKLYDGCCSLSGLENKALKMLNDNEKFEDAAKYVLCFIADSLTAMAENVLKQYPDLPVIFSGGVMSNSIIKEIISSKINAYFAKPEFSSDNAMGIALLTLWKENK